MNIILVNRGICYYLSAVVTVSTFPAGNLVY